MPIPSSEDMFCLAIRSAASNCEFCNHA